MGFSEILQAKIDARRFGASPIRTAVETLRQQALNRDRLVDEAVSGMADRLALDPVFAAAFGAHPKAEFVWAADNPEVSSFSFDGPAGTFAVTVLHSRAFNDREARTSLRLEIRPAWALSKALGCGIRYAEATPVEADADDLPGFLEAVEDMLAEFLADVYTCGEAEKFLPGLQRRGGA